MENASIKTIDWRRFDSGEPSDSPYTGLVINWSSRTKYVSLSLALIACGAVAQISNIDFGDDSSSWANDGECDDPRFVGEGVADLLLEEDRYADASDCRRLYQQGLVELRASFSSQGSVAGGREEPARFEIVDSNIDFGDDSSAWANDGECDDPRFVGEGGADLLLEEDRYADASDCRKLYQQGLVELRASFSSQGSVAGGREEPARFEIVDSNIDFGDDSSAWANDGECDDPRFVGEGGADLLLEEDRYADASDCRKLYQQGLVELRPSSSSQR